MTSPNEPSSEGQALEQLLRQLIPPLRDDGFTQRVMASLPPRAIRSAARRRLITCILGAAAGVGFIWQQGALSPEVVDGATTQLVETLRETNTALSGPGLPLALFVAALSLFIAFPVRRKRRWSWL